jgi:hypothetical protein
VNVFLDGTEDTVTDASPGQWHCCFYSGISSAFFLSVGVGSWKCLSSELKVTSSEPDLQSSILRCLPGGSQDPALRFNGYCSGGVAQVAEHLPSQRERERFNNYLLSPNRLDAH